MMKSLAYSWLVYWFFVSPSWADDDIVPVKIFPLQKQNITQEISAWGEVETNAQTLSFERAGYIQALLVEKGQRVKAGQALARLDDRLLENQQQQAQVNLKLAKIKRERVIKLKRSDAIGQEQLDEAENLYQQRLLALQQIQLDLEKYSLRAAQDGLVLYRFIEYPTAVSSGTPVFSFKSDTQPWEITVKVSARQLPLIHVGDSASLFTSAFPEQELSATVSSIAAQTQSADQLFEVSLSTSAQESAFLRAGMQVKARLQVAKHQGYQVPLNYFYRISSKQNVLYLLDKNNQAQQVEVPFSFVQGNNAVLNQDLSQFSAVIISSWQYLKPGVTVKVLD